MPTVSGFALGSGSAAKTPTEMNETERTKARRVRMKPPPRRALILGQEIGVRARFLVLAQRFDEKRQADVHPVVDVGVVVVEFLVGMPDAVFGEAVREGPAAEVEVGRGAPAAAE